MKLELARLAVRHGVATPTPRQLPSAEPVDQPLCIEGIAASANSIDATRMMFAPCAFRLPAIPSRMPKLLYRHDDQQVAGEIKDLFHDRDGNLRLRALVAHELAKRAAGLSVGVTVLAYELKNVDTPSFYALITHADVPTEISLTPMPADARALVTLRYPEPAVLKFYDLMGDAVRCLIKQVEVIQKVCSEQAAQPARTPARRAAPVIAPPRRPTPFSQLVQEINR